MRNRGLWRLAVLAMLLVPRIEDLDAEHVKILDSGRLRILSEGTFVSSSKALIERYRGRVKDHG